METQPEENIARVTEIYMIVPQEVIVQREVQLQHYVMRENIHQPQEEQAAKLVHAEHILIKGLIPKVQQDVVIVLRENIINQQVKAVVQLLVPQARTVLKKVVIQRVAERENGLMREQQEAVLVILVQKELIARGQVIV